MAQRVHPVQKIRRIHSNALLPHSTLIHIPGALIMIREGNNRSGHSQNQRRINLAMRILHAIPFAIRQLLEIHCNQSRLLLLHIQELHIPFLQQILKFHFILRQLPDLLLPQLDLIIFADKQRPLCPPRIRIDLNLIPRHLIHHRNIGTHIPVPPHRPEILDQSHRIIMHSDPISITKDLTLGAKLSAIDFHQILHIILLQIL